ncbi:hypothetical protein [Streptomyces sp. NPDC016845]|uniref:hypothetical protein n=1 Tax=Streptomyces sp. NPDC016845 TaxID=3364972 RepID=UPI00378F1A5B
MPKDPYALLRALVRAEATRDNRARKVPPRERTAPPPASPRRAQAAPHDQNDR